MAAVLALVVWAGLPVASATAAGSDDKEIFGWVEAVQIGESRLDMDAKLDTGADTSSLHTTKFRRSRSANRQVWVEFRLTEKEGDRTVRFKRKLVRYAYIKEHGGTTQKRPVVSIEVCLGSQLLEIEVTLVDRSVFDYPVLLGRNALEGHAVVDPAARFTAPPQCPAREVD